MGGETHESNDLPRSITPSLTTASSTSSGTGVQVTKMACEDLSALLDSWDESILDSVEDDVTPAKSSPLVLSRGKLVSPSVRTERRHALSPLKVIKKTKRSIDPTTTPPQKRSFKRMKDAIVSNFSPPKQPGSTLPPSASEGSIITFSGASNHVKALPPDPNALPENIPLPTTPHAEKFPLPPVAVHFSNLDEILTSFDSAMFRQQITLDSLRAYKASQEAEQHRIVELEQSNAALDIQLESFQRQSDGHSSQMHELQDMLAREKEDKRKAMQESRGIITRLEKRLEDSGALVTSLRHRIELLEHERARAEGTTDARLFEAQQRLDQMQRDRDRDAAEWQRRLDEAEFAHLALKESGTRLQKELMGRDRRNADLERGLQERDRRIIDLERRKR